MAFRVGKTVQFPLADTYNGPTAIVQFSFNFAFLPGISAIQQLDVAVRAGLFGASVLPFLKANYLGYVLEEDTDPFFDAYRVTVSLAGETQETEGTLSGPFRHDQGPGAFIIASSLVALVLAVGAVLLIFGPIGYRIFNGGISEGVGLGEFPFTLVALGLGAVALAFFLGGSGSGSRSRPSLNPGRK